MDEKGVKKLKGLKRLKVLFTLLTFLTPLTYPNRSSTPLFLFFLLLFFRNPRGNDDAQFI